MADASAAESGGALVLGGCGFVGRHLVALLVEKGVRVRVADKTLPVMANLAPEHQAAFDSPLVQFKQADLSRQAGVDKAYEGGGFSLVFNLTYDYVTYGQADEVYQQHVVDSSTKLGMAAAACGVKRFVELSTAQVYEANDKAAAEAGSKLKPWTKQATYKLRAEAVLRDVPNLPLVVLRPATIYGVGDVRGLSPRVLCAAVYQHLGEKMKFAWDAKLRANTVHVADVAAACWHVGQLAAPAPVYNLADSSNTCQGTIGAALESIFSIKVGFLGTVQSTAMKAIGLRKIAEDVNAKHMDGWQEICKAAGVNTMLTPHIDAELLAHNHLSVDGRLIGTTGFVYAHPQLTADTLRQQVDAYVAQKLFPPVLARAPDVD